MPFCKPLKKTTIARDLFVAVSSYLDHNLNKWKNLVGVCTDNALGMLDSRNRFVARIKQKHSNVVGTHYVIHREALASRTLSAAMNDKLAIAICVSTLLKQVLSD